MGEQVRIEKDNEWLGRKTRYEFPGKLREKERYQILRISFCTWGGYIRSGRHKVDIWVGHNWKNKFRNSFFSIFLGSHKEVEV